MITRFEKIRELWGGEDPNVVRMIAWNNANPENKFTKEDIEEVVVGDLEKKYADIYFNNPENVGIAKKYFTHNEKTMSATHQDME